MWDGRLPTDVLATTVHGIDPHHLHDLHRLSSWSDVRYTMFGGMICADGHDWSKSSTDFMLDASASDLSVSFRTKF
jgi:hypothetical protein